MGRSRLLESGVVFVLGLSPATAAAAAEFVAPFLAYQTAALPFGVAAGDVDGDGRLDLVAACAGDAALTVRLALESGRFGERTDFATDASPSAVALGDVDGDARLDAVVVCYDADRVDVLRGGGDGTFALYTRIATPPQPKQIALAELDGDGRLDLVSLDSPYNFPPGALSVWLGTGDGGFGARTDVHPGGLPVSFKAGDVDGDGHAELVVAQTDPEAIVILWNDGHGGFPRRTSLPLAGTPVGVGLGDWNSDGRLDGAVYTERVELGSLLLRIQPWIGGSDGQPVAMPEVLSWGYGSDLVSGDVNADGHLDLVVLGTVAGVHLGRGDGTFGLPRPFDAGNVCWSGLVAELDGDDRLDVAVAATDSWAITLLHGNGDGTFGVLPLRSLPGPTAITSADFDRDARADLALATTRPDHIVVHRGRGDGGFDAGRAFLSPPDPLALATADLDGDGAMDLVSVSFESGGAAGHLAVLHGDGLGGFTPASDTLLAGPATSVVVGDWNADGKPDVASTVWTNDWPLDAAVETRLGRGDGSFGPGTLSSVGPLPMGIACTDLDGDGRTDLVATFRQAVSGPLGGVTLLRGDGGGGFGGRVDLETGPEPRGVAGGDVDADGNVDLVVANSNFARFAPGNLALLVGRGGGAFGAPASVASGMETTSLVLADFDGDGNLDAAAANAAAYTVTVVAGRGDGSFGDRIDWGTGSRPAGLAAADFDGDGRTDLATCNTESGSVTILLNRTIRTPIVVSGFIAEVCGSATCLSWSLAADALAARGIAVERAPGSNGPWTAITAGLLPVRAAMRFVDASPEGGGWYRLVLYAADGRTSIYGPVIARGSGGVESLALDPVAVGTRAVTIRYRLPRAAGALSIEVVDVRGQRIRSLAGGGAAAGRSTIEWDRRDGSGVAVARGVYWVRLTADGAQVARRFVLLQR